MSISLRRCAALTDPCYVRQTLGVQGNVAHLVLSPATRQYADCARQRVSVSDGKLLGLLPSTSCQANCTAAHAQVNL
jgi:hypothetical protein